MHKLIAQRNMIVQVLDALKDEYRRSVLELLPASMRDSSFDLGDYRDQIPVTNPDDLTPDEIEKLLVAEFTRPAHSIAWLLLSNWPEFGNIGRGELTRRQIILSNRIIFVRGFNEKNARQSHYEATVDLMLPVSRYAQNSDGALGKKIAVNVIDGQTVIEPGWVVALYLREWFFLPHNLTAHFTNKASLVTQGIALIGSTAIDGGFLGWIQVTVFNGSTKPFTLRDGNIICKLFFNTLNEYLDQPYLYASLSLAEQIKNE